MDWLDEIIEKIRIRIKNYSLKKALVVYIAVCVAIVAILTVITQNACDVWDEYIWSRYTAAAEVSGVFVGSHGDYTVLSKLDRLLVEIIDFVQTWSTIIYSIAAILGLSYIFYNNKLKEPLAVLQEAADKIGKNDLSEELYYDSRDEMGNLCRSFDLMRIQLLNNNQKLWDMMEEQKRLNAAFAHDLRTPLTVLKGYTDFLNQFIPDGKISEDKLISTLSLMSEHIARLENYCNTMKEINSLEELPMNKLPIKLMSLESKLGETIGVMNGKDGTRISLLSTVSDRQEMFSLDETIVLEVFDNLMSNALRYACKEIEVILSLSEEGDKLLLSVADDGKGFTKNDLIMADKPYYTDNKDNRSGHFGIGLYICKILCEKHQGNLTLENRMKQGAIVTAVFSS